MTGMVDKMTGTDLINAQSGFSKTKLHCIALILIQKK
jgi:hypothetical protein